MVILSRDHGGPWQNNSEVDKKIKFKASYVVCKRILLGGYKVRI